MSTQATTAGGELRNGTPFRVSMRFLSDWHAGTGTGRHAAVDRQVRRDADGFPMVGAKTAIGVLRDAAETVARGLDEDDAGIWHDWARLVFGSQHPGGRLGSDGRRAPLAPAGSAPVPAALIARPLRLPAAVRAAVGNSPRPDLLIDAMVTLRPGVRIDPAGVAADECFRVEERAAAGLVVTADWQLCFDTIEAGVAVPWEAELLLRSAARLVEAVGGKRRRGAGRCLVTIGPPAPAGSRPADRLATLLSRIADAAAPPSNVAGATVPPSDAAGAAERVPAENAPGATALPARARGELSRRYELRITALTPVIVARGVIGNLVRAAASIPGTSLLPIVARAIGPQATEAITGGRVVVTNATIEIAGRRSVPVPRALQREKGNPCGLIVNQLHPACPQIDRPRPLTGFCVDVPGQFRFDTPELVEHAHAVIDDHRQRPDESTGGLYVYQAIAAGTVLRAEVWLADDVRLTASALTGEYGVGRSRKDDYGQVRVEALDRREQHRTASQSPPAGELIVWLTSDLLLRGAAGEPVADVESLRAALERELDVTLELPAADAQYLASRSQRPAGSERPVGSEPPFGSERPVAMVSTTRVESWQRRWTLPRPSLTGLAAGSVVRFAMTGTPNPAAVRTLQARGLGERTAEGFGRLRLQPALLVDHATLASASPDPGPDPGRPPASGGRPTAVPPEQTCTAEERQLLARLKLNAWREELRRLAVIDCLDPRRRDLLVPGNATAAQLGTVRALADRLLRDGDPAEVIAWLADTAASRDRAASWDRGRLERLQGLITVPERLWEFLGATPDCEPLTRVHLETVATLLAEAARATALARQRDDAGTEGCQIQGGKG